MKRLIVIVALSVCLATPAPARAAEIYLDKLDKQLNDWWNILDDVCRGAPGGSEVSDLGCAQRLQVDAIIEKRGCRNIYPATGPHDTSYWVCKQK